MNLLKAIFTWWTGATIGATLQIKKGGVFVGEDETGNRYFETKDKRWDYDGRNRRFVIYNGYADASKVSPDWHGWLHHTFEEPPTRAPLTRRSWEKDHIPNSPVRSGHGVPGVPSPAAESVPRPLGTTSRGPPTRPRLAGARKRCDPGCLPRSRSADAGERAAADRAAHTAIARANPRQ
jgi:NADH:ubiquinone oxidoreductase subunit